MTSPPGCPGSGTRLPSPGSAQAPPQPPADQAMRAFARAFVLPLRSSVRLASDAGGVKDVGGSTYVARQLPSAAWTDLYQLPESRSGERAGRLLDSCRQ